MPDRKLGKKAGAVVDPRSLMFASLLTPQLPPVIMPWRIAVNLHRWGDFGNFNVGDCTCASLAGHRVQAQEWSSGRRDKLPVTTEDALTLYSAVTGYNPADPSTDRGAYLIDVLRYARSYGFGMESDGTPHTIGAYAQVDPHTLEHVKQGAHLFGGLYLGVGLPERAEEQINNGEAWSVPSTRTSADEPYSWGGHAVWMIGYDTKGITLVTWGAEQRATWGWFDAYCDEAWAVISEDFVNRLGRTPQGFNADQLAQFLSAID